MENGSRHVSLASPFYKLAIWGLVILMLTGSGCEKKENPIKVGFVGGLTGRLSDLGTAGRNGAILAVEEINTKGGIHGRPVEIISKDDKQDPEVALQVDRELLEEGVVAIIGHMTSTMSMVAIPFINKHRILMISPTTSTDKVSGIDDHFIRVMSSNTSETDHLARHAFSAAGVRKMAVIYDLSNRDYTVGFFTHFKTEFERLGGTIKTVVIFTSGKEMDFAKSADSLLASAPDGMLIVTSAPDAAMITQRVRMKGSKVPFFLCGWAMTDDLLHDGGPAVEGVVFSQLFDRESQRQSYVEFRKKFKERFGRAPNFAAALSYEAARALLNALSENDDPQTLRTTLLRLTTFEGLQGNFKMDPYGDPQRKRFLVTINDGRFRTMADVQE